MKSTILHVAQYSGGNAVCYKRWSADGPTGILRMSATAEAAIAKIAKMLREQFAAGEVTMDTDLMADLSIWGEDAIDFMNR